MRHKEILGKIVRLIDDARGERKAGGGVATGTFSFGPGLDAADDYIVGCYVRLTLLSGGSMGKGTPGAWRLGCALDGDTHNHMKNTITVIVQSGEQPAYEVQCVKLDFYMGEAIATAWNGAEYKIAPEDIVTVKAFE